jgi:hypothetical protein
MSGPISGSSTDGLIPGVLGSNTGGLGVWGLSDKGNGVFGSSNTGTGVVGQSVSGKAGEFQGNVTITGKLTGGGDVTITGKITGNGDMTISGTLTAHDVLLSGKDCAEEFEIANSVSIEPGTVVVMNDEGSIGETSEPYNKRVAGVIAGAGKFHSALILGRNGSSGEGKAPVALVGRVYCKVDASYSGIEVGDMLTTSPTSGCAMKASDPARAFGAVIGKALASIRDGRDLIPILVALQ